MTISLQQINIYPVKSCQGITLQQAELGPRGLLFDRHWMLVDDQGDFLSQRQHAILAQVATELTKTSLILSHPKLGQLEFGLDETNQHSLQVSIWNDHVVAKQVNERANQWFSQLLGTHCRLVFIPADSQRQVDPDYADTGQTVGFADGFPLLIVSQASVNLLSQKLGQAIDINRFRANLVLSGCEAHAEDNWSTISIGETSIDLVKACSRCIIPSIDQRDGSKMPQILKTLASYRKRDNQVYFGQNAIHRSYGWLKTGQIVTVESL